MYKVQRAGHIESDLQITDKGKELTLHVDLHVEDVLQSYNKAALEVAKAQEKSKLISGAADGTFTPEQINESYEALGATIVTLFTVIFGEEQTRKVIDFYQGRYIEMLMDVSGFIAEEISPKIREEQEKIERKYETLAKKQWR